MGAELSVAHGQVEEIPGRGWVVAWDTGAEAQEEVEHLLRHWRVHLGGRSFPFRDRRAAYLGAPELMSAGKRRFKAIVRLLAA